MEFSVTKERRKFKFLCKNLYESELEEDYEEYVKKINNIFIKNLTIGALKYAVRTITYGTPAYNVVARIYKQYIKGL